MPTASVDIGRHLIPRVMSEHQNDMSFVCRVELFGREPVLVEPVIPRWVRVEVLFHAYAKEEIRRLGLGRKEVLFVHPLAGPLNQDRFVDSRRTHDGGLKREGETICRHPFVLETQNRLAHTDVRHTGFEGIRERVRLDAVPTRPTATAAADEYRTPPLV